ncbi:hypothetical protein MARPO_0044s0110 [Marchantia polymorpha]|uniref:Uncharacterized protein n=1 Tax=Marchantia polymorpha TaxID=3197 RepID=A0A2R6X0R5_MARPO|nr:hypothetical protein MARPO_0044s0110 [Marchantia polymorpha]|eukprot:PTQ39693.1 hypothetical protein MARPO_0044s0110 [Marchantia polymorpha]
MFELVSSAGVQIPDSTESGFRLNFLQKNFELMLLKSCFFLLPGRHKFRCASCCLGTIFSRPVLVIRLQLDQSAACVANTTPRRNDANPTIIGPYIDCSSLDANLQVYRRSRSALSAPNAPSVNTNTDITKTSKLDWSASFSPIEGRSDRSASLHDRGSFSAISCARENV